MGEHARDASGRADGGTDSHADSSSVTDDPDPDAVTGIDPGVAVDLGEHRELIRQQAGSSTFDNPNVFMLEYGADRIPLTRGQIRALALAAGFDVTDTDQ